jgi:hypothetical protein
MKRPPLPIAECGDFPESTLSDFRLIDDPPRHAHRRLSYIGQISLTRLFAISLEAAHYPSHNEGKYAKQLFAEHQDNVDTYKSNGSRDEEP